MKIKSLFIGATALGFGTVIGATLISAAVGLRIYYAPYDTFKWSTAVHKIAVMVGMTEYDTTVHRPKESTYYQVMTLNNGKQLKDKIDPYEWAARKQKAYPAIVYAPRDGQIIECGEHSIGIEHSKNYSSSFIKGVQLNAPCVVGKKIVGGTPLGTVLAIGDE